MNWEELSSNDFPQAVRNAQSVCLVPLSVIERHGHHLPTDTDWWYTDHPTHYRGDGRPATAEKGHRLLDAHAQALAKIAATIKRDETTPRLQQEFFAAGDQPL
jgi:creatinine amidohydrolase/Fe(II)-dependent formamide hydrolase-like protein